MFDHAIIIPAYNPDSTLVQLVRDLYAEGFERILVVNDGSDASCEPVFTRAHLAGSTVVAHSVNHGKGAALRTGITYVRELWPSAPAAITVDADGQHLPADVARVARESASHPQALVLGVRDFSAEGVPARSRLGNRVSAAYFRACTGVPVEDTQTGLRAIPAALFGRALATPGDRYDWEMAFLTGVASDGEPLWLVPIATVYLDGNRSSHFHPVRDSLRIFAPVLRFACSSLACAALDLALFSLLCAVLPLREAGAITVATVVARLLSAAANFSLNRRWSFQATGAGDAHEQAERYGALCLLQMMASAGLVTLLAQAGMEPALAKVAVDCCLAVVSFCAQRAWVFAPRRAVAPQRPALPGAGA